MTSLEDPLAQVFQACQHHRSMGHSTKVHGCPAPAELEAAVLSDRKAQYLSSLEQLPGSFCGSVSHSITAPCVLHVLARRALSVGNYGEARLLLRSRSQSLPCHSLLALERARLAWFVESFKPALAQLEALVEGRTPEVVRLRAQDVRAACLIELFVLRSLGELDDRDVTTEVPEPVQLAALAREVSRVAASAAGIGDFECSGWAALDAYLASTLVTGDFHSKQLARIVDSVVPNGKPHALRRIGCVLACIGHPTVAVRRLEEAYRTAERLYPGNVIGLKVSMDLARLSARFRREDVRAQAKSVFQTAVRRFVAIQSTLHATPLARRVNRLSRSLYGVDAHLLAARPNRDAVVSMLKDLGWREFEQFAAALARRVFGEAHTLPTGERFFDFVAMGTLGQSGEAFHLGAQVKSGDQAFRMHDAPGKEVFESAGYDGYIVISVAPCGPQFAKRLDELKRSGIKVLNWMGDNLIATVLEYPDVLG